jgi:hypothetical protein
MLVGDQGFYSVHVSDVVLVRQAIRRFTSFRVALISQFGVTIDGIVTASLQFFANRSLAGAGNALNQIVSDAHLLDDTLPHVPGGTRREWSRLLLVGGQPDRSAPGVYAFPPSDCAGIAHPRRRRWVIGAHDFPRDRLVEPMTCCHPAETRSNRPGRRHQRTGPAASSRQRQVAVRPWHELRAYLDVRRHWQRGRQIVTEAEWPSRCEGSSSPKSGKWVVVTA